MVEKYKNEDRKCCSICEDSGICPYNNVDFESEGRGALGICRICRAPKDKVKKETISGDITMEEKSVTKVIEEVKASICDEYCRYPEAINSGFWEAKSEKLKRICNKCPLNRL